MTYSIIEADPTRNREEILHVWENTYPGILGRKYEWIYENNPSGHAQVWLARHEQSGHYIGVAALFSRSFIVNGLHCTAGIAADLLVDEAHRCAGVALMLQRSVVSAAQQGKVDFIYGFPNNASDPIFRRVGYHRLGDKVRFVNVLKTEPYLSTLSGGRYWAPLLGPVIDFSRKILSRKTLFSGANTFVCEQLTDFDQRFDRLFDLAASAFPIVGERRSTYLRWKFIQAPQAANKIWAVLDVRREGVLGYIVHRPIGSSVEVRDFLAIPSPPAAHVLIASFLRHVRSSGATSITLSLLSNPNIFLKFLDFGFVEREPTSPVYLYCSDRIASMFPSVYKSENWLLLQSDDDM